ncbi:MAG TPA: 16S rRNA (guanine(527)-N(7))-methyltransferase RsmG [Tepidiformaceae bacterium]|nr:16S rRNA (guanine(527)-N(7))-methyltransferase RsmG [Tepidiformaceae bacterium]
MDVPDRGSTRLGWEELPGLFAGFENGAEWLVVLRRHAAILERERSRVRVSAVEGEDVIRRQYAESLEIARIACEVAGETAELVVDVGSGGGFPGIVMAVVLRDTEVVLVEPLKKRAALLATIADELGLRNVRVEAVRAEEAGRGWLRDRADLITARAVAETRELLEYMAPLARPGGLLVLAKGSSADEETAAAGGALAELGCEVSGTVSMRPEVSDYGRVVVVRKVRATPARYPRRPGVPAKRPL